MAPFGTASVAIATTPTVVSTFFSHLLSKPSRRSEAKKSLASGGPGGGPENDLSYEEGLKLVRRFLDFSSHRGVEEVQAFTAMQVPTPHWVRREVVVIPDDTIEKAATILGRHLGSYGGGKGIELVGGERWWQVRGKQLEAEWIEMQKDYLRRKARRQNTSSTTVNSPTDADDSREANGTAPPKAASTRKSGWFGGGSGSIKDGSGHEVQEERVILYIHGGAFFFSSLDTHRYQVQRHARKAGARAFSPAYRLAPQYPFPCGLLDSLAAYLYLLTPPPDATHAPVSPTDIIFMGDSAGAGMCISLLVLIREMGLPMPAGASLISPWVDLTHSMPSISGSDLGDFIPSSGFHYRPSATWPPLPGDGITSLSVEGTEEHYDNQVQMYCANNLLSHPLISPVNQGSLGGLCPLLIIGGGGELLRDEIIYLANKAANPTLYSPSSRTLSDYPEQAALIDKYKPTRVHLQVYEGCCHVVPTLSWTSSAKYMYRACANFNIWAYTAAAKGLEMRFAKKEKAHRHGHEHKHKRRQHSEGESGTESETVSRSSTLGSASGQGSRKGSGEMPSLARLAMTTNDAAAATITDSPITPTSAGSTGTPAFNSTDPSLVDLTQPLISSSAAAFANKEGVCEEDVQSECSSSECSSAEDEEGAERADDQDSTIKPSGIVSVTGTEPIPLAGTHIVSERVSTRGRIRPFEPVHQVPALHPDLKEHIGQVHPEGAIKKWMAKRAEWDEKYRKDLDRWWAVKRADRERAEAAGYLTRDLGVGSGGTKERPPLSALAGWYDREMAREVGKSVDEAQGKMGMGAMLWMRAGGKADKEQAGGETMEEIKQTVQQELQESAQSGSSTDVQSQDNTGASGTSRAAGGTATARGRRRSSVARPASAGLTGRARADTIRSAQVHVQMAEERAKGDAIAPQEKAEEQRINRA